MFHCAQESFGLSSFWGESSHSKSFRERSFYRFQVDIHVPMVLFFKKISFNTGTHPCVCMLHAIAITLAVTQLRTPSGQNLYAHTPSCTPSTMGTPGTVTNPLGRWTLCHMSGSIEYPALPTFRPPRNFRFSAPSSSNQAIVVEAKVAEVVYYGQFILGQLGGMCLGCF